MCSVDFGFYHEDGYYRLCSRFGQFLFLIKKIEFKFKKQSTRHLRNFFHDHYTALDRWMRTILIQFSTTATFVLPRTMSTQVNHRFSFLFNNFSGRKNQHASNRVSVGDRLITMQVQFTLVDKKRMLAKYLSFHLFSSFVFI